MTLRPAFGSPRLQVDAHIPPLRIMYLAHAHPEHRRGGTESCALLLYEAMRERADCEPWFVTGAVDTEHSGTPWSVAAADPRQIMLAGGEYDSFWGRLHDRRHNAQHWLQLLQLLRPQVVHFHHVHALGYDFLWQVRNQCPDAPIVYTLHDYVSICVARGQMVRPPTRERCSEASPARCHACLPAHSTSQHFLRTRWVHAALDLVDRFVAPSQFLKERYVDWGLPADRIQVLENARRAYGPADAWAPPTDRPPIRFGYFGQLCEVKGVLVLLRAARLLERRGVDVEIGIHGVNLELQDPAFQATFHRELAACARIVTLHPPYERHEVDRRMRAVDWVVVPSEWWENSPLVIQEAFANQRPVICSDIGGMAEKVRTGVDGLHFPVGDGDALAAVIESAASSRDRWNQLSRATPCPPRPADAAAAHAAIYRELLQERGSAPAATEPHS